MQWISIPIQVVGRCIRWYFGSACRGAMASIALPHVSTENDRQINLSQRVLSAHAL